ncbi:MAG: DUF488 domain-containing protein [Desulfurobacteriaceae bacterium]
MVRKLYTIGFSKKTAQEFFEALRKSGVQMLVDIRRNNKSQISGYAKFPDLPYFLSLFEISYLYLPEASPSKKLLQNFRKERVDWEIYKDVFCNELLKNREFLLDVFTELFSRFNVVCLLCSENDYRFCHRTIVATFLREHIENLEVLHILKKGKRIVEEVF